MVEGRGVQNRGHHAAVLRNQRVSRRLKRLLPILIALIVLFIFMWPHLKSLWVKQLGVVQSKVDVSKVSHEGELLNPHYFATNNQGEPFEIKARSARAINTQEAYLDDPLGCLKLKSGKTLTIKADKGVYCQADQMLTLNDNGLLTDQDGTRLHFRSSVFLLKDERIYSDEPVYGEGPMGGVSAQGMEILQNGATVILKAGPRLEKEKVSVSLTGGEVLTTQGDVTYLRSAQTVSTKNNVEISSPKGLVKADEMVAHLTQVGAKLLLERVEAMGHVFVQTQDGNATGDSGTYYAQGHKVIVKGNVTINRQNHQATGTEVEIDLKTGLSNLKSKSEGKKKQVRIILDANQLGPLKSEEEK